MQRGIDGMKFLHKDPDSVIVEVNVVRFFEGEIENSPICIDQLNHAISKVRIVAFNVPDDVDEGLADVNDLLIDIPMTVVENDDLNDILVDWAETTLGTHSVPADTY